MTMIIDCHGHYTVLPKAHDEWREAQKAAFKAGVEAPAYPDISDDEIRETIESNQLRLLKERGSTGNRGGGASGRVAGRGALPDNRRRAL